MPTNHFDLIFYMWSELLVGSIQGESFVIPDVVSGGGRGSSGGGSRKFSSYNPNLASDDKKRILGGSIPPGLWRIERPSEYVKPKDSTLQLPIAKLTPAPGVAMQYESRDYVDAPFLIHGPGGKTGSKGCILVEKIARVRLLGAVEKAGGAVLLVSTELRDGGMLSRNLTARRTA